MSQLTTHVLNTSLGKPAQGVTVILYQEIINESWQEIARGETNEDGRLANLLLEDKILKHGKYRLTFLTGNYFKKINIEAFYPSVPVVFQINEDTHYHIPLLISPFGYSTYRGN